MIHRIITYNLEVERLLEMLCLSSTVYCLFSIGVKTCALNYFKLMSYFEFRPNYYLMQQTIENCILSTITQFILVYSAKLLAI